MSDTFNSSDFTPVTGGVDRSRYVCVDDDHSIDVKVASDLDRHIVRILKLHPALKVQFRNQDISALDDAAKQLLLMDMNDVLGIRPLNVR